MVSLHPLLPGQDAGDALKPGSQSLQYLLPRAHGVLISDSCLVSISSSPLFLKLTKPVLPAVFGGRGFSQLLQSESPCKHVEADPGWIHQPRSSLQAASLHLVLEKCLAWLFLLGFISFCSSIHCLDLWLCLHGKTAEPALIIPPQAPSDLLHFLLWGLSLYLEMILSCGKPAGTLVPVRCNAWPCQRLRDLYLSFCLQIFRLPNLRPPLSSARARSSARPAGCKPQGVEILIHH